MSIIIKAPSLDDVVSKLAELNLTSGVVETNIPVINYEISSYERVKHIDGNNFATERAMENPPVRFRLPGFPEQLPNNSTGIIDWLKPNSTADWLRYFLGGFYYKNNGLVKHFASTPENSFKIPVKISWASDVVQHLNDFYQTIRIENVHKDFRILQQYDELKFNEELGVRVAMGIPFLETNFKTEIPVERGASDSVAGDMNSFYAMAQYNFFDEQREAAIFTGKQSDKYSGIVVSNDTKYLFPMFIQFDIDTIALGAFGDAFESTKTLDNLIAWALDPKQQRGKQDYYSVKESQTASEITTLTNDLLDVEEWMKILTGSDAKIKKALLRFKFNKTQYQQKYMLTVPEIYSGWMNYNEPLFYVVNRYNTVEKKGTPEKTYVFKTKEGVSSLIDVDILYGEEYTYEVILYKFVLATEYSYVPGSITDDNQVRIKFKPRMLLEAVPLFDKTLAVCDKPPPPPEVEIRKKNDKLLFVLNPGMSIKQKPIVFYAGDLEQFNKILLSQNLYSLESPVEFSGDDKVVSYEVFSLKTLPKSYIDFSKANRQQVDCISNSTTAYVDIEQFDNDNRYYVFRAKDMHGHISNPTLIFELKKRENNEYSFNTIELEEQQNKVTPSVFRRFIQIRPAKDQMIFNQDASGEITESAKDLKPKEIKLGIKEDSSLGKEYALYIRSKATGRVVKFKFKFKRNPVSE